ncbi:hypothetical protein QTJ16_003931 [Diplocarpon rosae]|uniref:Uncharacterized protein n=1 Tax=Diplocarpon rosae TaxID=946125 RepID=A0AAD9T023_9HELO|nr:hypothetical protein QTJ16_003931 [Diplocarpon rosae]
MCMLQSSSRRCWVSREYTPEQHETTNTLQQLNPTPGPLDRASHHADQTPGFPRPRAAAPSSHETVFGYTSTDLSYQSFDTRSKGKTTRRHAGSQRIMK